MVKGVIESIAEKERRIPQALNLDHGNGLELCKKCVDFGFSSVMIDGSSLPYEENIQITKKVVDCAHEHDASVEAELGRIGGIEERMTAEHLFTKPKQVPQFLFVHPLADHSSLPSRPHMLPLVSQKWER